AGVYVGIRAAWQIASHLLPHPLLGGLNRGLPYSQGWVLSEGSVDRFLQGERSILRGLPPSLPNGQQAEQQADDQHYTSHSTPLAERPTNYYSSSRWAILDNPGGRGAGGWGLGAGKKSEESRRKAEGYRNRAEYEFQQLSTLLAKSSLSLL